VGVDVTDMYQTYFDTQLISRCNWYPLLYWILETALINSLIIYRDLPWDTEHTVKYIDFHLSIVQDILQAGSPLTMKSSSCIPASQIIIWAAPAIRSALPSLPTTLVTKHTPLPHCWKVPGMHSPLCMESRVDYVLCRWRRSQGGSAEGMKTSIQCEDCNEALCFTPKQNCFYEFHHM